MLHDPMRQKLLMVYNLIHWLNSPLVWVMSILVLAGLAICLIYYALINRTGCPACRRIFVREEVNRRQIGSDVKRYVVQRGRYCFIEKPSRRAWEELTENIYAIYEIKYRCTKCGSIWLEQSSSIISTSKYQRDLPTDEFHLPD